jgi:outer membrane murein-binding lipoprotein Lpp
MRWIGYILLLILAAMLAIALLAGCYVHHDNDKCLYDNKIRHSKQYRK